LLRKFPQSAVDFIFFSDEKIFTTAVPVNLQNDRVYAAEGVKKHDIPAKRLLRTRPTFSKSLMVSVAASKLGCTELIFVEPGAKVDSAYYRDVCYCRSPCFLAAIRHLAGDTYVFQQDNAPAHRAQSTVEFLRHETPDFIPPDLWPPCSPDLNPVDYKICGCMQQCVYKKPICDLAEMKQ